MQVLADSVYQWDGCVLAKMVTSTNSEGSKHARDTYMVQGLNFNNWEQWWKCVKAYLLLPVQTAPAEAARSQPLSTAASLFSVCQRIQRIQLWHSKPVKVKGYAKKDLRMFVSVENKGAYRCLTAWRAGHSNSMCTSSATATLPQCVQTLLALTTCWPPAKRPRTIGSW